jgi:hypothetical protein
MPIFRIEPSRLPASLPSSSVNNETFPFLEPIGDYSKEILNLKKEIRFLRDLQTEDLLHFFDCLSGYWLEKKNDFFKRHSWLGASYLIPFLQKKNLSRLAASALHGNPGYLDGFCYMSELGKKVMAHPRGLATHWIAGNVLFLGFISLVQGILTRNVNVIKVPANNGLLLPELFSSFDRLEVRTNNKAELGGRALQKCVLFVYTDPNDREGQSELSLHSDIRILWGGQEAVADLIGLPKKSDAQDVVFGPKYSFVVIGRNDCSKEKFRSLATKIAREVSVFEQRACTSPHTVFVEEGGEIGAREFAQALSEGMRKALRRYPKTRISADEAYRIIALRGEHLLKGDVFSSEGTEWTVIYSEDRILSEPCFSRVVFVRPFSSLEEI